MDREKEIIDAIKEMGLFRTNYPNEEVSAVVSKALNTMDQQTVAQERYNDLLDYFHDKEMAESLLNNKEQFRIWLERMRWNVKHLNELDREQEKQYKTQERQNRMNRKIASLDVTDKWEDKNLAETLEKAGYILTIEFDGITEKKYIISKELDKEDE